MAKIGIEEVHGLVQGISEGFIPEDNINPLEADDIVNEVIDGAGGRQKFTKAALEELNVLAKQTGAEWSRYYEAQELAEEA